MKKTKQSNYTTLPKSELRFGESILLNRTIDVFCIRIIGEIGVTEARPEIHAILSLATAQQGQVNIDDIANKLLGELPRLCAERLYKVCQSYNLLDNDGVLTEDGEKALTQKKVFVPQKGIWDLWLTKDPLSPVPLVTVKAFDEPQAHSEARDKQALDKRRERMEPLDKELKNALMTAEMTPLAPDGNQYHFMDIENKVELIDIAQTTVSLSLNIPINGITQLNFYGQAGGRQVQRSCQFLDANYADIWQSICDIEDWHDSNFSPYWQDSDQSLRVEFSDWLTNTSKTNRLLTHQCKDVYFDELGNFDPIELFNIPLKPIDNEHAQQWALWTLTRAFSDYVYDNIYQQEVDKIKDIFGDFCFELPMQSELASLCRQNNQHSTFWQLQAPLDWSL